MSKHQDQPECREWTSLRGTGRPNLSRETKFSGAKIYFPCCLGNHEPRIGKHTRLMLIHTLLYSTESADHTYYRESAGTGPLALKIVPVMGAAFSGITMDQFLCASLFPHLLMVCSGHV